MIIYKLKSAPENIVCFAGDDKYENELLIKWGWPEDIWFHVDNYSSPHVYIRFLPPGCGKTMDDLTPEVIEEVCQICKGGSIEGCKLSKVRMVYTPWANLHKDGSMDIGTIGFHDERQRRYYTVEKRDTACLKYHEKSKVVREGVDFQTEKEQRDAEARRLERMKEKERKEEEKRLEEEKKKALEQKHYTDLFAAGNQMKSNQDNDEDLEDDFM